MEEERKAGNILTVLDSPDGGISAKKRSTVKQILTRQFFKTEIKTVLAGIFLEKTERFSENVSSRLFFFRVLCKTAFPKKRLN